METLDAAEIGKLGKAVSPISISSAAKYVKKNHNAAYFTFGRFQPPTSGHAGLINSVRERAEAAGADAHIFVSSSVNNMVKYTKSKAYKDMIKSGEFESIKANENPLNVAQKVHYLKKMHKGINIVNTTELGLTNIVDIVENIGPDGLGYKKVVMVVGSDRVDAFKRIFSDMPFMSIEPYGEKRVKGGISGTKMRMAAVNGDIETFTNGVLIGHMTEQDVLDLMNDIRMGLGYPVLGAGGSLRKTRKRWYRRSTKSKA
jgi:hypothetical protein